MSDSALRADAAAAGYRGRIAPTPSGFLHLGHARTFWTAQQRALQNSGQLILRNEDLDRDRCRPEFAVAMLDDLRWFGFVWQEGPDIGGPHAPYVQQQRVPYYHSIWQQLALQGVIYPSPHSRRDIAEALVAPHEETRPHAEREPIFPTSLRPPRSMSAASEAPSAEVNWRFRVPDGQAITFVDGQHGPVTRTAGVDFGDFLVWRKDGFPSYELAVVADDHAMQITEVVRGDDLLTSTARQLLLYRALGWRPPAFYHCPLLCDAEGRRLSKRSDAVSLRQLRAAGHTPESLRATW